MTYQEIIDSLRDKKNFSFSRFGDGELNCMFGVNGKNCDGHKYFEDLGNRLKLAWLDPKGVIAVQRHGYEIYKKRLGENYWPDADILHKASILGELGTLMTALEGREVVLVGPDYLKFKWVDHHVYVPLKNAWISYNGVRAVLKPYLKPGVVVVYCCGMMAEVLIWDLYRKGITQIDAGSVFDPYCGRMTRQYHKKLNI